jgi:hypothetical protein
MRFLNLHHRRIIMYIIPKLKSSRPLLLLLNTDMLFNAGILKVCAVPIMISIIYIYFLRTVRKVTTLDHRGTGYYKSQIW